MLKNQYKVQCSKCLRHSLLKNTSSLKIKKLICRSKKIIGGRMWTLVKGLVLEPGMSETKS